MAYYNRMQVGLRKTGHTVTVPNNPKARLMYYINSICSVLQLDDDPEISRFRNYSQYYTLSHTDTSILINLGYLLKPDILLNKCIFQNDQMCGDSGNEFYNIEAVSHNFVVAGSILIGGQRKRVTEIMTFKMSWLNKNWTEPMQTLLRQQQAEREAIQRQQRTSDACVIL